MDVEIIKKDGTKRRLSEFGVVYDFVLGSISIENYAERIEGRTGLVDYGADYGSRRISVPMKFKIKELHEFAHFRDELYGLLTDTDSFYIREMRRPVRLEYEFVDFGKPPKWKAQTENTYVDGKQYKVRMIGELKPEQIYDGGEIEIEFETTELPFAETVYRSVDLNRHNFSTSGYKFGLAEGIKQNNTQYTFTESNITVHNSGTAPVDCLTMDFSIIVKGLSTNGNFTIYNRTTGERFQYNQSLNNKTLKIANGQVTVDYANKLRDTNKNFITLNPGLNNLTISNGTYDDITFDFKFYYK